MPTFITKDLGPCAVNWDPALANLNLNPLFGGCHFRQEDLQVDVKEDEHGETPVDKVQIGKMVEVDVPMSRSSISQLQYVIAGAVGTATKLTVSNAVGGAVYANAKELILKPIVDGVADPDTETWLHILKAYPKTNLDQAYDNAGQKTTMVTFTGFPDQSTATLRQMWRYGPA